MSNGSGQKTKISAGLSTRVVTLIQAEATRQGISFADVLRRVTDDWADKVEAAKAKPVERVVVLDRASGQLHNAR